MSEINLKRLNYVKKMLLIDSLIIFFQKQRELKRIS